MQTSVVTAKIKLLPSDEQMVALAQVRTLYTKACNWLSAKVYETKELGQIALHNAYYQQMRAELGIKAQMTQSVIKTVIARYKSAKSNNHPWTLIEFSAEECDLVYNRDYSYNRKKRTFSIGTVTGRTHIKHTTGKNEFLDNLQDKDNPTGYAMGTAKLWIDRKGQWFILVPMGKQTPDFDITQDATNVVGVDLGLNFIATTYDSKGKTNFHSGREVKHRRAQCKDTRRDLQRKQTPSARSRLKSYGSRENRYVTDVNHQITKALVTSHPKGTVFVLEDLTGIRQVTEKVKLEHRYVQVSWAYYQFRQLLEYKAKQYGHSVLIVDAAYTSQTCPKCGHVHKSNRNKQEHRFECRACHYKSNDDRVGAMNLHRKGIEKIGELSILSSAQRAYPIEQGQSQLSQSLTKG